MMNRKLALIILSLVPHLIHCKTHQQRVYNFINKTTSPVYAKMVITADALAPAGVINTYLVPSQDSLVVSNDNPDCYLYLTLWYGKSEAGKKFYNNAGKPYYLCPQKSKNKKQNIIITITKDSKVKYSLEKATK